MIHLANWVKMQLFRSAVLLLFIGCLTSAENTQVTGDAELESPEVKNAILTMVKDANGIAVLYSLRHWLARQQPEPELKEAITALGDIHGQIGNGGFSQYFFNSSGNDWKHARSALAIIRNAKGQEILDLAAAVFGKNGPAIDGTQRHLQIKELPKSAESTWDSLDRRWHQNHDEFEKSILDWIRINGSHLRFVGKPKDADVFKVESLLTEAADDNWHQTFDDWAKRNPRVRSYGCRKSDMELASFSHDCFITAPNELHLIVINSADPNLSQWLLKLRPLSQCVHLLCVVFGKLPDGTSLPDGNWCFHIEETDPTNLGKIDDALASAFGIDDPIHLKAEKILKFMIGRLQQDAIEKEDDPIRRLVKMLGYQELIDTNERLRRSESDRGWSEQYVAFATRNETDYFVYDLGYHVIFLAAGKETLAEIRTACEASRSTIFGFERWYNAQLGK
jgi:hypothetical protein